LKKHKVYRNFPGYFKEIKKIYSTKDYTEHTFRTSFENLINSLKVDYKLIHEPKRTFKLGAPDFKAFYGSKKVGSIETKPIGENLDKVFESDQIKKYIGSIDNLILTDYARFMLIRNGKIVIDFNLFTIANLDKNHFSVSDNKIENFIEFIDEFFSYDIPTIKSAEELARGLSKKAKYLKEIIIEQLTDDIKKEERGELPSTIYDFYLGIKGLIKDINIEDCADNYAQTVTYGLFLAKKNSKKDINRESAYSYIPKNMGIIKSIFLNISGSEFPSNITWIIEDIITDLNATDMTEIFDRSDKRGKKDKDPILFFYEDFLNFYEPERKKQLGVYYTPRPVVNFIVNSTHFLLKDHFDKPTGLADDSVKILDPATGTGTFFWITFLVVFNELINQRLKGLIKDKIQNHLLKHFYGFEILITPYVIAHLQLADVLQRWHYKIKDDERIQIYLTNSLEPSVKGHRTLIPFFRELSLETIFTSKIKSEEPIIAIIGNPPYSGTSSNQGEWINNLLKEGYERKDGTIDDGYYKVNSEPLKERNTKWLQDDYVKFIRFAQWKIDTKGEGIVGFITNHSYLDNPTFRGMRESLLESFDRIYILNLHGNTLKQEQSPDGSKDENVFNIKQGVAITIFIKNNKFTDKKVLYSDLWGAKEFKYNWLDKKTVANVRWQEIKPSSEFYFFVPKDTSLLNEYEQFWKIKDIFPVNSIGIVTARDSLTIHWTADDVWKVINNFANLEPELARESYNLKKDSSDWKVGLAQEDLKSTGLNKNNIVPMAYRPFDIRYTHYTGKSSGFHCRPRSKVMKNMLEDNLGLITCRQQNKPGFDHVFVSDIIADSDTVSNRTRERGYLFPLYIYQNSGERTPNFDHKFLEYTSKKYGKELSPEETFYYIYAILHSTTYRNKYVEFLQSDFPRIPFIDDYDEFKRFSTIGKELVEMHLMKKRLPIHTNFDVEGSNIIEKVRFKDFKLWFNNDQYFDGVPNEVWEYRIGGYKVIDHWLKDRINKKLSSNEIQTFLQIIEIIKLTIIAMKKIDEMYKKSL
jgi:hypothetical protein